MQEESILGEQPERKGRLTISQSSKFYIIFFVVYACLYAFLDGYLTSIPIYINTNVIAEFNIDISTYYGIQSVASFGLIAVICIQFLADLVGRKPALIISFFGMSISGGLMAFAQNTTQFTVLFFFQFLFISSDIWVILVAEEVSREKRARYVFWITVVSVIATILGPISRAIWMLDPVDAASAATWRMLPLLCIFTLPFAFLGFGIKESSAFLSRKHSLAGYMSKFNANIRSVWAGEHKKKLISFLLAGLYFGLGFSAISAFDKFLTTNGFDTDTVTRCFIVMVMFAITAYFFLGPISDHYGRKRISYILGVLMVIAMFLLVFTVESNVEVSDKFILVAILSGILFSCYWTFFGLNRVHCIEVFPTNLRGTALGYRAATHAIGVIGGSALASLLTRYISLGTVFIIYTCFIIVILISIYKTLPETKKISIVEVRTI